MEESVILEKENFEEFLRTISILIDECNDVDIKGGVIRQRSNQKTSFFEIDMNNILPEINMPMTDLKQKIDLLKIFLNEEKVEIINSEDWIVFTDYVSKLKFRKPLDNFLDNNFISLEELEKIFVLDESQIILKASIPKNITDRIKTVSKVFNVNSVKVYFDGIKASIKSSAVSGQQAAMFIKDIITEKEIEKSFCSITTTPFILDHDTDIDMTVYMMTDMDLITKFSSMIGFTPINIFVKARLT